MPASKGSFLQSGFLWGANAFFPIEPGPVPEASLPIVEMHFRFAGASTLAATVSSGLFRLLLLALLFLLATLESPAGLRKKLLYWGVLVVGGICPVLPFMLADSTYINRLITFTFPSVPFCLQRLCLQSAFL